MKNINEYDFLGLFYKEMLSKGHAQNLIRLPIDARLVEKIYDNSQNSVTENELQNLADICLANGWVNHAAIGAKYGNLQLTTSGFSVFKSKQRQLELLNNRSLLKKASDYIEEHKGLFVLLGFVVTVVGIAIKYYGGQH